MTSTAYQPFTPLNQDAYSPYCPLCISFSTYGESLSNNQELVEFGTDHFLYFMTLIFDSDAYHCQGSEGLRPTRGRI